MNNKIKRETINKVFSQNNTNTGTELSEKEKLMQQITPQPIKEEDIREKVLFAGLGIYFIENEKGKRESVEFTSLNNFMYKTTDTKIIEALRKKGIKEVEV